MKPIILVLLSYWLPVVAEAQSLSMYGLLDAGIEHLTNIGVASSSLTRMPSLTGSLPSRLGLKGTEDLGGQFQSVFLLEEGFAANTGVLNQGGRVWGRQAYVGLTGPWGTLTLGRQYTMTYWSMLDADILGPNIYGLASIDPYLANARADNAISYRSSYRGLTFGATFSFGRDNSAPANCAGETPGETTSCREESAMLKYDEGRWGVAASIDRLYGGPGGGAGLSSNSLVDQRAIVNGYVNITQQVKVGGGLLHRVNDGAGTLGNSDLWFIGAAYRPTPFVVLDGTFARYRVKDSENGASLVALRASYLLSKQTLVYTTVGRIFNSGLSTISVSGDTTVPVAPPSGGAQTGIMLGVRHMF